MNVEKIIRQAGIGAQVFVSYVAGANPTERAKREAERAKREGLSSRHFVGRIVKFSWNKNGDFYFTIFTSERDDERRDAENAFRSFNPGFGVVLTLEVIQPTRARD